MANLLKNGIVIDAPFSRRIHIRTIVTDYTGTLAFSGTLSSATTERLTRLAQEIEIFVVTSDSFGTAAKELAAAGLIPVILREDEGPADEQKQRFAEKFELCQVAALGNGRNDRLLLRRVRDAGGLALAVDNGEGCSVETLLSAEVLIHGAENALDMLLHNTRAKATLRN